MGIIITGFIISPRREQIMFSNSLSVLDLQASVFQLREIRLLVPAFMIFLCPRIPCRCKRCRRIFPVPCTERAEIRFMLVIETDKTVHSMILAEIISQIIIIFVVNIISAEPGYP